MSVFKKLLTRLGTLSGILIDETEEMPSSTVYRRRFGSLIRAYELIGYTPVRDYRYVETNRALRELHHQQYASIIDQLRENGARVQRNPVSDLLTINDEFTTSLVLARCRRTRRAGGVSAYGQRAQVFQKEPHAGAVVDSDRAWLDRRLHVV